MNTKGALVRDVVRSSVRSSETSICYPNVGAGLRTKIGGYILAKTGLRIKILR